MVVIGDFNDVLMLLILWLACLLFFVVVFFVFYYYYYYYFIKTKWHELAQKKIGPIWPRRTLNGQKLPILLKMA